MMWAPRPASTANPARIACAAVTGRPRKMPPGDQRHGGQDRQRPREAAVGVPVGVVVGSGQQETSQNPATSSASAPIQRATLESTLTTTRSRARSPRDATCSGGSVISPPRD